MGQKAIVDVWAHLEKQRAKVLRRVELANPRSDVSLIIRPKGPFKVERGTTLYVRLELQELLVEPPEDVIAWEGEIGNASFDVIVPSEIGAGQKTGSVKIYWEGGLQLARVPIQITVAEGNVPTGAASY